MPRGLPGRIGRATRADCCSLLLLFAAVAALAQQPQTIDQIRVIGNRRIPKETILARLFTHVGDTYDPISVERDFNSLWNTGYFDDLRIEREDSEKGIILNVFVRKSPPSARSTTRASTPFPQSDLLDRFKKEKVGLSVRKASTTPPRSSTPRPSSSEVLAEHGHQFATIKTEVKTIPPASVQVNFNIKEGPTVKVGQIKFTGNEHVSSLLLRRVDEEPEADRHSVFASSSRTCSPRPSTPPSSRKTPSGCARPTATRATPTPRSKSQRRRFATRAA